MRDRLIKLLNDMQDKGYISAKNEDEISCHVSNKNVANYLLENGVIVPPCKVGDKVYYFSENPLCLSVQPYRIYEADVVRIVTVGLGTSLVIQIRNEYGCTEIPDVNEWGKTVFLTKEEAEQALKGGEG